MARKPRPSSMPMLAVSPRWVNRPEDPDRKNDEYAEAAAIGTLVHETMYKIALVANDRSKWSAIVQDAMKIEPSVEKLVMSSLTAVDDLFSLCLPVYAIEGGKIELSSFNGDVPNGLYPEVGVNPGVTEPGTADLVVILGEVAEMVDYKNTFVERDHDYQMKAYVSGIFDACPKVQRVHVRIVTPRLGDAHEEVEYTRDDLPHIKAELGEIAKRAEDPFYPCSPSEACVTCAGNGRCPWQIASLCDVPIFGTALPVNGFEWTAMLEQNPDVNVRARRRYLIKWLEKFIDSVKEWDKQWALDNAENPVPLPGFKTVYGKGRSSLDKDRLAEINVALMAQFGIDANKLIEYAEIDVGKFASFISMLNGITETDAGNRIKGVLSAFKKDGTPTASFRVDVKQLKSLGPQIAAMLA